MERNASAALLLDTMNNCRAMRRIEPDPVDDEPPETVEPFCLVPVGWPMGKFGPVTRRPLEHILHWNGYKS